MKKNTSVSLSDFVDDVYILKALTRYNNKFKNKEISKKLPSLRYFIPDKSMHKLKKIKEW